MYKLDLELRPIVCHNLEEKRRPVATEIRGVLKVNESIEGE